MAYQPEGPEGWYGARGLIWAYAIWILECIILFIIYYQAKIAVVNEDKIWLQICLSWRTFSLWHHWYAFFARVLIFICIFCTAFWYWRLWRRQYHAVEILHIYIWYKYSSFMRSIHKKYRYIYIYQSMHPFFVCIICP
jgi:hypothetical protein